MADKIDSQMLILMTARMRKRVITQARKDNVSFSKIVRDAVDLYFMLEASPNGQHPRQ
jgi:hypothetical protein